MGIESSPAQEVGTVSGNMVVDANVGIAPTDSASAFMHSHPVVLTVESLLTEAGNVLLQPISSDEARVTDLAADHGLPVGLKVHKPGFELGIRDHTSIGLAVIEEGELSQSSDDVGSQADLTAVKEVALLEESPRDQMLSIRPAC